MPWRGEKRSKNRKEAGRSGYRYYIRWRPYTNAFHFRNQFGTDPLRFFFTTDENFDFFRFFRTVTPVRKNAPRASNSYGGERKGQKLERKPEDQVIDTMSIQYPILVPFIPWNSLELIPLNFFSRQAKILSFFDFFAKWPLWSKIAPGPERAVAGWEQAKN